MLRIRLFNAVLLAALMLAVSRLWLFLGAPPPALPKLPAGETPLVAASSGREPPAESAETRPGAYDVIVARNLFSPARGVVPPEPAAAVNPVPTPPALPKLTLYGVVIVDGDRVAYLQEGTQTGRPKKVRESENFAGGVVKAIRPDGVTFLFAGSEISVPLRSPKPGVVAPPPPGREPGPVSPPSGRPVAFPRLRRPTGIQAGQLPAPGRPISAPPGMEQIMSPDEPGDEVFGDEELPEGSLPVDEMPVMGEEEEGD